MKLLASVLGIGHIRKGGGTVAAAVAVVAWYAVFKNDYRGGWPVLLTAAVLLVGVWAGNVVEKDWGKDSSKVVIDEVAGMWVSLLWVPVQWGWLVAAFVFFRFFDIAKPLGIRRMEALKGGWGVMADDVLAGIYANICLQLAMPVYGLVAA
ncbi:MAG: phosphatidylglycerophosphatase A [Edaphocola sp.]